MTDEEHDDLAELKALVRHLADEVTELIARVDGYSAEVQACTANFDELRAEWMRRTLNGQADTLPPTTGPSDETPPKGWKLTQQ